MATDLAVLTKITLHFIILTLYFYLFIIFPFIIIIHHYHYANYRLHLRLI